MGQVRFAPFMLSGGPTNNSPIGTLAGGNPIWETPEFPFLNFFKAIPGWTPLVGTQATGEQYYLYKNVLDSHGYPTTLTPSATSTFTGSISDGAGGSGTMVKVTALGTGIGPWHGGLVTGTGVTGGTFIQVPNPFTEFDASFSGTTMTVSTTRQGLYITPGMTLEIPLGPTVKVVHCPTSDTLAHCQGNGAYTIDTNVGTIGSTQHIFAQQYQGQIGTYIASVSQNAGSTTITEAHQFDSVRGLAYALSNPIGTPWPGGNNSWELVYTTGNCNPGSSNFTYRAEFTLSSHSCNGSTATDLLNAVPDGGAFRIDLTTLDPANPVSNIRLCYLGNIPDTKTSCENGTEYFNPAWINQIKQFRSLRTMFMIQTIANFNTSWTTRAPLDWPSWADPNYENGHYNDVPLEVLIQLANETNTNMWLNSPCDADGTYLTNEATLVLTNLNSRLKVIKEICNEPWNTGSFSIGSTTAINLYAEMSNNGLALFPSCGSTFSCILNYNLYQAVQMSSAYHAVWTGGNASRVKIVLGGQYGNNGQNNTVLDTTSAYWSGNLSTHVDALSVAPYWTDTLGTWNPPDSWSADADYGVAKMGQDQASANLRPSQPTTGNCGNGAGFSCNPVDTAHFTLTTDNSPNFGTLLQNNFCTSFITTNASTGSPPQLKVDGGTSYNLDSSLTNHTLYLVCFQNGNTWHVQNSQQLGDCGNGAGKTCAGSDSSHFLLTTGQSLPDPPANQTCVYLNNSISPGATPNFIKTDGGTYYAFKNNYDLGDAQLPVAQSTICFTSQNANGAISPGQWKYTSPQYETGSDLLAVPLFTAQAYYTANNRGLLLYGYEGGFGGNYNCGCTVGQTMIYDYNTTGSAIGSNYATFLGFLKDANMIEFHQTSDPGTWFTGLTGPSGVNYFPMNAGTYGSTVNNPRQLELYSYINSTPCWWAGCAIH